MKLIRLIHDPRDNSYILQMYTSKASLQLSKWSAGPLNLSKLCSTLKADESPCSIDDWLLDDYIIVWTQPFDEFFNTYPEYFV